MKKYAAIALACAAGTAHAQVIDWDNAAGGDWFTAGNWSPAAVPVSSSETASIALPGTYTVALDGNIANLGSVSMTNPDASFIIELGRTLGVAAGMVNNGSVLINPTAGGAATTLNFTDPGGTLTGTGSLLLNGVATRSQITSSVGASFTHGLTHTIHGFGRIEAAMQNDGTIRADSGSGMLELLAGPKVNTGTMSATGDGTLRISAEVAQTASGEIVADGGYVEYRSATVRGGSVNTLGAGFSEIAVSSLFDGVTLAGDVDVRTGQTFVAEGVVTNNATLTINPTSGGAATAYRAQDSGTLGGTGDLLLNGFSSRAQVSTDPGMTLTHAAPHTIHGFGRIIGTVVNDSLISADVSGQAISVLGNTVTNNNRMDGSNGGVLSIEGATIQNAAGTIVADGGTVFYSNATIVGGTIDTVNAGVNEVNTTGTLFEAVTLDGDVAVRAGQILAIEGGLVNNATLTVNPTSGGAQTGVNFDVSGSISGTGSLQLNGLTVRSQLTSSPGITITNAAPHTIEGFGRVVASLINNSLITGNTPGSELEILNTTVTNNSTISGESSGTLEVFSSEILNSNGSIVADGGTVLYNNATIRGGTIDTVNAGLNRVVNGSVFDQVTIDGELEVEIGDSLTIETAVTNNAAIIVNQTAGGAATSMDFDADASLNGTGTVVLNGTAVRAQLFSDEPDVVLTNSSGHTISGIGRIAVSLDNEGTIAPGLSVGTLTATESITMGPTSVFDTEVNGNESSDLLDSTSTVEVGGTLDVTLIDGFAPTGFWASTIIDADAGITGTFDVVNGPASVNPNLEFYAVYLPNSVRVGWSCPADYNLSGDLNFFDLGIFLELFNAQEPQTDLAAPFGVWNFFDLGAFLTKFNQGCPF